jgi:hypothetical protein
VDFEGFRVEGGASPLARLLRGFAGAGLTDRFIAIFDNDAAGHEALISLKRIALPSNIRAITLPDLAGCGKSPDFEKNDHETGSIPKLGSH